MSAASDSTLKYSEMQGNFVPTAAIEMCLVYPIRLILNSGSANHIEGKPHFHKPPPPPRSHRQQPPEENQYRPNETMPRTHPHVWFTHLRGKNERAIRRDNLPLSCNLVRPLELGDGTPLVVYLRETRVHRQTQRLARARRGHAHVPSARGRHTRAHRRRW